MKGAYRCSLTLLTFLCVLKVCELCFFVRASRATKFVAEGGSLRLSCEVQHCGVAGWTGGWVFQEFNTNVFTSLIPSERIEMSRSSSIANSTNLFLHIHNINQSDAGVYKCSISWPQNTTSSGHVTLVNVTAAAEDSSGRSISHRVLLCFGALMCFPVVLGFFWCFTRDPHPPSPPVSSRSYTSFQTRVKPRKEVVYAEVAMNDSRRQNDHPKQASEPTVYASVRLS